MSAWKDPSESGKREAAYPAIEEWEWEAEGMRPQILRGQVCVWCCSLWCGQVSNLDRRSQIQPTVRTRLDMSRSSGVRTRPGESLLVIWHQLTEQRLSPRRQHDPSWDSGSWRTDNNKILHFICLQYSNDHNRYVRNCHHYYYYDYYCCCFYLTTTPTPTTNTTPTTTITTTTGIWGQRAAPWLVPGWFLVGPWLSSWLDPGWSLWCWVGQFVCADVCARVLLSSTLFRVQMHPIIFVVSSVSPQSNH